METRNIFDFFLLITSFVIANIITSFVIAYLITSFVIAYMFTSFASPYLELILIPAQTGNGIMKKNASCEIDLSVDS